MPGRRSLLGSLVALLLVGSALTAATALAGPNDPQLRPRTADVKLAKTLVLSRSELPGGFVDKGPQKQTSVAPNVPCAEPNLHALVMTADVNSHRFVRSRTGSYAELDFEGTFFRHPADAEKAVGSMMSKAIGSCLKGYVVAGFDKGAKGKAKIVSTHVTPLSEAIGDLHVRMWDLNLAFQVRGITLRAELVLAFYRRGRVVSSMMMDTLGGLSELEAKDVSESVTVRLEALPPSAVV